jgi:hypothetical protein
MRAVIIATVVMFFSLLAMPLAANAFSPFGQACTGAAGSSAVCTDSKTGAGGSDPVTSKIGTATHLTAIVAGIIAVIMMIVGGIRYITSSGDANAVSSAKNTVIYSAVGLVVVVLAQSIIVFVVDRI